MIENLKTDIYSEIVLNHLFLKILRSGYHPTSCLTFGYVNSSLIGDSCTTMGEMSLISNYTN